MDEQAFRVVLVSTQVTLEVRILLGRLGSQLCQTVFVDVSLSPFAFAWLDQPATFFGDVSDSC